MVDVLIVGAGASGLATAIVSARRGKKVVILEKNNKVGKKLLATGNGKCNIANTKPNVTRFYSENRAFLEQVLEGFSYKEIKTFFRSIGLELIEAKEGKVFPMSLQASSVVALLEVESAMLGVEIICETTVSRVEQNRGCFNVIHTKGRVESKSLVVATGHQSAPQLGGVVDGVGFARAFGHRVISSFPTLVQLTSSQKGLKEMAGVKVYGKVTLVTPHERVVKEGDILFTTYGISGLAILDISRRVLEQLKYQKSVTLSLDLMPKMSHEQLLALMKKSLQKKSKKPLEIWFQGFINKKLILPILKPLKLEKATVGELLLNLQLLEKIVTKIKHFNFTVDGSKGYKGAEVATGGVNTKEVDVHSLESKKVKGLYFAGEVLDVDGDRGGFNLHFAWVCALRVGRSI